MISMHEHRDVSSIRVLQSLWLLDPLQEFVGSFGHHPPNVSQYISSLLAEKVEVPTRPKRRVHFDTETTIYEIPSHTEYSDADRNRIWSSSVDILRNAERNRREFSSEGWDWYQVKEETEMFFDKTTRQYIHPIHLGGLVGLRI
jgi:hypothetical protein